MERKNAFNTNTGGYFTHGEGTPQATTLYANNDAFKRLDSLSIAFDDADLDAHRISWTKFREIVFHLGLVDVG
jgi:hypothetical protein